MRSIGAFAVSLSILFTMVVQTSALSAPDRGQAYLQQGYKQLRTADYAGAVRSLTEAVKANPADMTARRYLCKAWIECGMTPQAIQQIEVIRKSDPGKASDQILLGDAYYRAGEMEKSTAVYMDLVRQQPMLELAQVGLIKGLLGQGLNEQAEPYCIRLLQTSRDAGVQAFAQAKLTEIRERANIQIGTSKG
jgi:tetratricopeptide (TPR) repeat protein